MFGMVGSPTTVTARMQRESRDSAYRDYGVRCWTSTPAAAGIGGEQKHRSGAELRSSVRPSNASVETLSTTSSSERPTHVRQRPTAGHLAGAACLGVAAQPFCDNFRLTGCRVWPILLPSSLLLHCFTFTFCLWAKREYDSSTKLPPEPALSAPTRKRLYQPICRSVILLNSSQGMSRWNRFCRRSPFGTLRRKGCCRMMRNRFRIINSSAGSSCP
jgi:hypothetical protein